MAELAKPGAGLPAIERFVANRLIRAQALRSRSKIAAMLEQETHAILSACELLDDDQAKKQVLIDRFIGIEDSSRNWSVFMTLQHLCIVNAGMQAIIESLTGGESFDQTVRIEDVKPDADAGPEFVDRFSKSSKQLQQTVSQIESLKTGRTHTHPWFGDINAKQWYTLAAVHTQIHRKQIEKISQRV